MYQPKFNSVLVEIDDKDAEWGGENGEAMLGKSYSKGKVIAQPNECISTQAYPMDFDSLGKLNNMIKDLIDKDIMWNEGTEAGTTFEHDGKLYGFIYWFDIRGVKE